MKEASIPQNYHEWQHCIIFECGLELTPGYISERLSALQNEEDYYTQQFVRLYGEHHLRKVIGWFMQAQKSL